MLSITGCGERSQLNRNIVPFPDLDKIMHREVGILNIVHSSFRLNHGLLIFCNDLPVRYYPPPVDKMTKLLRNQLAW